MDVSWYIVLSALIFCVGLAGVLTRRNPLVVLLSLELLLNAVNLALVAFSRMWGNADGQIFALVVMVVAACEVVVGLAVDRVAAPAVVVARARGARRGIARRRRVAGRREGDRAACVDVPLGRRLHRVRCDVQRERGVNGDVASPASIVSTPAPQPPASQRDEARDRAALATSLRERAIAEIDPSAAGTVPRDVLRRQIEEIIHGIANDQRMGL